MIEFVLGEPHAEALLRHLLKDDAESSAVLFAGTHRHSEGLTRALIRDIDFPAPEEYARRGRVEAELRPSAVARVTKRARSEGLSLVFAHSHPGAAPPSFSSTDDLGENAVATFLAHRHPMPTHGALVASAGGWSARRLGTNEAARLVILGKSRVTASGPQVKGQPDWATLDRQVRAFGEAGQRALDALHVAIVGLGGTGSLVAQQLAHLGVRTFTLIDPDTLDATNLNRVAGAELSDIGAPKVDIARRYIERLLPHGHVDSLREDVMRATVARRLCDVDVIFGCTDSHGSRAVLQQIAYQFMIPCIDMGTTIVVAAGLVTHVYGRVQLLAPGHACLTCSNLLDPSEVRRDMMSAFERQADPYVRGAREPAPAVMSLNGVVSSLAVTMLLAVAAGVPMNGRHLLLNAMTPAVRTVRSTPGPTCYICSTTGAFARGDQWPLFARQD